MNRSKSKLIIQRNNNLNIDPGDKVIVNNSIIKQNPFEEEIKKDLHIYNCIKGTKNILKIEPLKKLKHKNVISSTTSLPGRVTNNNSITSSNNKDTFLLDKSRMSGVKFPDYSNNRSNYQRIMEIKSIGLDFMYKMDKDSNATSIDDKVARKFIELSGENLPDTNEIEESYKNKNKLIRNDISSKNISNNNEDNNSVFDMDVNVKSDISNNNNTCINDEVEDDFVEGVDVDIADDISALTLNSTLDFFSGVKRNIHNNTKKISKLEKEYLEIDIKNANEVTIQL